MPARLPSSLSTNPGTLREPSVVYVAITGRDADLLKQAIDAPVVIKKRPRRVNATLSSLSNDPAHDRLRSNK